MPGGGWKNDSNCSFPTCCSPINVSCWQNLFRSHLTKELQWCSSQAPAFWAEKREGKDQKKVRDRKERACRGVNTVRLSVGEIGQNKEITVRLLASNFSGTLISPKEERFYFLHGNKEKSLLLELKYLWGNLIKGGDSYSFNWGHFLYCGHCATQVFSVPVNQIFLEDWELFELRNKAKGSMFGEPMTLG